MREIWKRNVEEMAELLPRLGAMAPQIDAFAGALLTCWENGGKAMFAGNGGSAADAMHFAEELIVRFHKDRRALAAVSLCDPTVITCAANDFGFDQVFSRQVEGLGKAGDILVLMSTSGNSVNLVNAANVARSLGVKTVAMLGKDGGQLKGMCDIELIVPSSITHHIQEVHKMIYHAICQWVDHQLLVEGKLK